MNREVAKMTASTGDNTLVTAEKAMRDFRRPM